MDRGCSGTPGLPSRVPSKICSGGNGSPPGGQISLDSRTVKYHILQCSAAWLEYELRQLATAWPSWYSNRCFFRLRQETSTTCASKTQLIPRATTTLWIQSLLLVPSWPFSRYSSSPFLLFFPPPPHALSVPSISFLPYPSFTPATCWRAEMGEGPSSCLQVGIVLFRVGKKENIQKKLKSFKVTGNWEEASLGLPTLDSSRYEAVGRMPIAPDTGIS